MVLTRGVLDGRPDDAEEGHASPVRAADLDGLELAAADEAQSAEEEVVGLEHVSLPWTAGGEVGRLPDGSRWTRLSSDLGPASGRPAKIDPTLARLRAAGRLRKPPRPETLSRPFVPP